MSVQPVQYHPINKGNLVKTPINAIPSTDKKDEVSFCANKKSNQSIGERLKENLKKDKYFIMIDGLILLVGGLGLLLMRRGK